jgi:hypothetical protein
MARKLVLGLLVPVRLAIGAAALSRARLRPPGRIAPLLARWGIVMPFVKEGFEHGMCRAPLVAENQHLRAIGDHHQHSVFDLHGLSLQTALPGSCYRMFADQIARNLARKRAANFARDQKLA